MHKHARYEEKGMGAMTKLKQEKVYDPHLLYHAINITVELEYKVPMQKIYSILERVDAVNEKRTDKIKPQDILEILKEMGDKLEESVLSDEPSDETSLQAKIKELLRLLGCTLTDQELNKILKGEVSINEALSKKARAAWLIVFEQNENGKFIPNKELANEMLFCTQLIAIENVELKMQRLMEGYRVTEANRQMRDNGMLQKNENIKVLDSQFRESTDPILLDKKRNRLRLYIAHMHGYDRDRDGDGSRGIDMTTGYIIDFGDIYIADKEHGCVIEDRAHNGIDMSDII